MLRSPIACALLFASIAAAAPGCGTRPEAREPEPEVAEEIAELRAQRRRDRIRLHKMEERMARLAAARGPVDRPQLPVERLVPAAPEGEVEVVAVTGDGTEIVYVDEAAEDDSVAAPTDLLRDSRPAPRRTPRLPPPIELPASAAGDSLGTTRGRIPKVAQVTRAKPRPPAQAREPIAASPRPRRRRPPVATTPASAVAVYQRLVAKLRAGEHAAAIAGFRRFVARYPRSDYADNAQYWLGEAYYDQKKFTEAHREFLQVAERFPGGNKVSDALLKAAFCRVNLGQSASAIQLLERVIAEHPDSRPAQLARQKLERLRD